MVRLSVALLLVLSVLACDSGEDQKAAFAAFGRAFRDRDWDSLYDLAAPSERTRAELYWDAKRTGEGAGTFLLVFSEPFGLDPEKVRAMTLREYFHAKMESQAGAGVLVEPRFQADAEAVEAEVEGDRCRLTVRGGGREEEVALVREGERWYFPGLFSPLIR